MCVGCLLVYGSVESIGQSGCVYALLAVVTYYNVGELLVDTDWSGVSTGPSTVCWFLCAGKLSACLMGFAAANSRTTSAACSRTQAEWHLCLGQRSTTYYTIIAAA